MGPPAQHATGQQPLTVLHNSLLPRPCHKDQLAMLTRGHAVEVMRWAPGGEGPPVKHMMRLAFGCDDAVCCAAWCDPTKRCQLFNFLSLLQLDAVYSVCSGQARMSICS